MGASGGHCERGDEVPGAIKRGGLFLDWLKNKQFLSAARSCVGSGYCAGVRVVPVREVLLRNSLRDLSMSVP